MKTYPMTLRYMMLGDSKTHIVSVAGDGGGKSYCRKADMNDNARWFFEAYSHLEDNQVCEECRTTYEARQAAVDLVVEEKIERPDIGMFHTEAGYLPMRRIWRVFETPAKFEVWEGSTLICRYDKYAVGITDGSGGYIRDRFRIPSQD
jgi:hypothetical protein